MSDIIFFQNRPLQTSEKSAEKNIEISHGKEPVLF